MKKIKQTILYSIDSVHGGDREYVCDDLEQARGAKTNLVRFYKSMGYTVQEDTQDFTYLVRGTNFRKLYVSQHYHYP